MNKEVLVAVVDACRLHLNLLTKDGTRCPSIEEMRRCVHLDEAIKLFDAKLQEINASKK